MKIQTQCVAGWLVAAAYVLIACAPASAQWKVAFEDKNAPPNCDTNVTIKLSLTFPVPLTKLVVPVVVRSIAGGAFWRGVFPVDTAGAPPVLVAWNWSNPGWANIVQEVRPGIPQSPCALDGDMAYDGVSPDHFVISVAGQGTSTPAEPTGRDVLSLKFGINESIGLFEFDTACFTSELSAIQMVDDQVPPVDHGSSGTGEALFTKGFIAVMPGSCPTDPGTYTVSPVMGKEGENLSNTIQGSHDPEGDPLRFFKISGPGAVDLYTGQWTWTPACGEAGTYYVIVEVSDAFHEFCSSCPGHADFDVSVGIGCGCCGNPFGELTCDGAFGPMDVIAIVDCVYHSCNCCMICRPPVWDCIYPLGDVDCRGNVNPADVVYYVNYVYKGIMPFPCDPCAQ
jgi:hypothetical protein